MQNNHIQPQPLQRLLKIEADGDRWKAVVKPKIRLIGRWLARAGFQPGSQVHVTCVSPGVIELRSPAQPVGEAGGDALNQR
jgi:hypothetical protein